MWSSRLCSTTGSSTICGGGSSPLPLSPLSLLRPCRRSQSCLRVFCGSRNWKNWKNWGSSTALDGSSSSCYWKSWNCMTTTNWNSSGLGSSRSMSFRSNSFPDHRTHCLGSMSDQSWGSKSHSIPSSSSTRSLKTSMRTKTKSSTGGSV